MAAPRATFPDRLALARRLVARGAARPPVHLADQLEAAGSEARVLHDRTGACRRLPADVGAGAENGVGAAGGEAA